jgi:hypothetical protein
MAFEIEFESGLHSSDVDQLTHSLWTANTTVVNGINQYNFIYDGDIVSD